MPSCHKCEHNGKKHRICLYCKGPAETNHHGKTHISFNAAKFENHEDTPAYIRDAIAVIEMDPPIPPSAYDPDTMEIAMKVLRAFAGLPPKLRGLVFWRLNNPRRNLAEYASQYCRTCKSKQGMYKRLHSIAKTCPELAAAITGRLIT